MRIALTARKAWQATRAAEGAWRLASMARVRVRASVPFAGHRMYAGGRFPGGRRPARRFPRTAVSEPRHGREVFEAPGLHAGHRSERTHPFLVCMQIGANARYSDA